MFGSDGALCAWCGAVEMQGVEPCSRLFQLVGFQRVETIPIPKPLF